MTPGEVLDTRIGVFWLLEKNISRLKAEDGLRQLDIGASVQSAEGYKALSEAYTREIGVQVIEQPKLDRQGLNTLKQLQQGPLK